MYRVLLAMNNISMPFQCSMINLSVSLTKLWCHLNECWFPDENNSEDNFDDTYEPPKAISKEEPKQKIQTVPIQSSSEDEVRTLGVNFINVLHARFSYERLFSSYLLALAKNSSEKRAHLMLQHVDEINGRCQFHQRLTSPFFVQKQISNFLKLCFSFLFFGAKIL